MTVYRNRGINYIFYAWYCVYDIYEVSTIELFTEVSLLRILSRDMQASKTGLHDQGTNPCRDIEGSLHDHYVQTEPGVRLPTRPPPRAELKKSM
jgi:hypothetical protein